MTTDERVLLAVSVNGPITQARLAKLLGLSVRDVQAELQALRLAGYPVASGDAGVWLATTADELAASNRRLRSRLVNQYRTLRAQQLVERRMRHAEYVASLNGTAALDVSKYIGEQADMGLVA